MEGNPAGTGCARNFNFPVANGAGPSQLPCTPQESSDQPRSSPPSPESRGQTPPPPPPFTLRLPNYTIKLGFTHFTLSCSPTPPPPSSPPPPLSHSFQAHSVSTIVAMNDSLKSVGQTCLCLCQGIIKEGTANKLGPWRRSIVELIALHFLSKTLCRCCTVSGTRGAHPVHL
jgi:hypothetical protein